MINKDNILHFIGYILKSKQLPPLTQVQIKAWKLLGENEIKNHIQNFYKSLNIDTIQALQYEKRFIEESNFVNKHKEQYERNSRAIIISILVIAVLIVIALINNGTINLQSNDKIEDIVVEKNAVNYVEASKIDKITSDGKKATIQRLLIAEDNRNMTEILDCFSDNVTGYWDLKYPSKQTLKNRYYDVWSKTSESSNYEYEINQISDNEFEMIGVFRYYSNKHQEYREVETHVKYIFDDYGKIKSSYGLK